MADTYLITRRESNVSSSKGSYSNQVHSGNTVRSSVSTPVTTKDVRVNDGVETGVTTTQKGDVTETKTTTGVGSDITSNSSGSSTTTSSANSTGTKAGEGVTIKFSIPIQQKNPVTLSA